MAGRNLFAEGAIQPPGEAEEGQPLFTDAPVQEQPVVQPVDGQPAIQEQPAEELPEGTALDVILDPAQAIVGGLGGSIAGGVAGTVQVLNPFADPGAGAEAVRGAQELGAEFGAPETKRGAAALETLGDLMEKGIDIARFPISGLAGLASLISGQGLDEAARTIEDVQTKGVGKTAGDRTFEATGDPLLATLAETSPEIVGSFFPLKRIAGKHRALKTKLTDNVKASSAQPELSNQIKAITNDIKSGKVDIETAVQSLDDLDIIIKNKSGSVIAGKVAKISDDVKKGGQLALEKLDDIADDVAKPMPQRSLAKYIIDGSGKLKTDPLAKESIKQGFDQGTVAAVSGASKADRLKMSKMVEIRKAITENALDKRRPSDIAGSSLLERVNHVKTVNREAGKQLDDVAKSLRGKPVDSTRAINNFMENLDEMGIRLDNRLRPNFKGSDIEGLSGPQLAIANMVKRMTAGRRGVPPDAFELHRMKRFIDENVTYGKAGEGLKGKTERVLKQLRRDLDTTLDNKFSEYNNVNTRYSDTVNALDALQDVAGKKMDLFGANADKAVGTLLRRLMGNTQSRINLTDAVDDLEKISRKYGAVFDDDVATQILFADELDSVFGPVARTSLAGEVGKGVKQAGETLLGQKTAAGITLEVGSKLAEKARGINTENAFKSITELLKRE